MRIFAFAALLLIAVLPARAATEADVRQIYAECLQADPDAYPGAVARWQANIADGGWTLHQMATWSLAMYERGWWRQMRAVKADGSPDTAARTYARLQVAKARRACNARQYRGR